MSDFRKGDAVNFECKVLSVVDVDGEIELRLQTKLNSDEIYIISVSGEGLNKVSPTLPNYVDSSKSKKVVCTEESALEEIPESVYLVNGKDLVDRLILQCDKTCKALDRADKWMDKYYELKQEIEDYKRAEKERREADEAEKQCSELYSGFVLETKD